MMLSETPHKPFEKIHIDIFTIENTKFLTIVDAFTKFGQAIELKSKNSIDILNALINYFSYYGTPETISSDQGLEFHNHVIDELLQAHKIKIHFTTPNHPESDGIIERFHSTIIEQIRILKSRYKEPLSQLVPYAVIAYNNTIHSSTNLTPLELTLGHTKLRDPFDLYYDKQMYSEYVHNHKEKLNLLYNKVRDKIIYTKGKVVESKNKNANNPFKEGQVVYETSYKFKRNKTGEKFSGPYKIKQLLPGNKAIIQKINKNNELTAGRTVHLKNLRQPIVTDSQSSSPRPSTSRELPR